MTQNIYDDPAFFEGYSQFPRSRDGHTAGPEWPMMEAMLPPLDGARVLDLGCGFGSFCRWARQAGARSVQGIDVSQKMLERARSLPEDGAVEFSRGDMETLALPPAEFDLIYSSLALHYVEDFTQLSAVISDALAPGGRLVVSIEHPIFTAPSRPGWQTRDDGQATWPLADAAFIAANPEWTNEMQRPLFLLLCADKPLHAGRAQ